MHDQDALSDYFRRYPLENPASYVGTRYDPAAAAAWRAERSARRVAARDAAGPSSGAFGRMAPLPYLWPWMACVHRLPPAAGR